MEKRGVVAPTWTPNPAKPNQPLVRRPEAEGESPPPDVREKLASRVQQRKS